MNDGTARMARNPARLQSLSPRERRLVLFAMGVISLALLWWVGLVPAINTLRHASDQRSRLDGELRRMQSMAASAEALRANTATPTPPRATALQALETATRGLGSGAQLTQQGDRATVAMQDITPGALAQWLQQVRINARLSPVEARLQRNAGTGAWSGQVILAGPGLGAAN